MELEVKLDRQHLETLTKAVPLTGITELIWNALDADATDVAVVLAENELGGVVEIRVEDNGHGMTVEEAVAGFESLGGSWKRGATQSPGGRVLHGRDGRGRFRAAGLGSRIAWHTVAIDPTDDTRRLAFDIEMKVGDLSRVDISDPQPTDAPTGTRVVIDGFSEAPPGLGGDGPVEKLTGTFGLYLQTQGAHLIFGGAEIDPESLQVHCAEYVIPTGEDSDDALLVVIEWNRRVDRAIYLCDSQGMPLSEQQAGIQASGFEFTAYLQWTGFASDDALVLAALGSGKTQALLETARDELRQHFKERAEEKTRQLIEDWKAESVYPFQGEPQGRADQVARDMFDVVAVSASTAVNATDNKSARRLSLRLLREALEHDPGSLRKVLTEVLDLKQDRLDELSELLDRTPLTALIETSKEITDRLEFLKGLEAIVLGEDSKHVKERSQLHRILANETWIFGEEYALAADDNSLTTVLKNHLAILGRDELVEDVRDEVLDAEGSRAIVDLMLARSLSQHRNRREHLVIELKAPSVAIGDEQAAQIRRYADAVAGDDRFNIQDVEWDFIIVSGAVRGMTERERHRPGKNYGLVSDADGIRIWVFTWADVIEDAGHRLKFVKELLTYQPDADRALDYLRKKHEKYLPPQVLKEADTEPPAVEA